MFIVGKISDADPENWTIESETKISEDFMFFDESVSGVPNYACFEIIAWRPCQDCMPGSTGLSLISDLY